MRKRQESRVSKGTSRGQRWHFILAVALVLLLAVASLFIGEYNLSENPGGWRMLWVTRWPRTASLILSGIAMALSGQIMQLMSQNRFVDASTSGVLEWSSLGILAAYMIFDRPTLMQRMTLSIIMAFVGSVIFNSFLQRIRLRQNLLIPIVGMMIGAVVSAFTSFLSLSMNLSQVIESWFVASFAAIEVGRYEYLWLILIVVCILYIFVDQLTIASLGEETATSLGLSYSGTILVGIAIVSLSVGITSAVVGKLPFIGLVVPNLVSLYRGDHLRSNVPWLCVLGAGLMLASDILSRTLIRPFEIPVSIILSIVGTFVLIGILLYQHRQRGEA